MALDFTNSAFIPDAITAQALARQQARQPNIGQLFGNRMQLSPSSLGQIYYPGGTYSVNYPILSEFIKTWTGSPLSPTSMQQPATVTGLKQLGPIGSSVFDLSGLPADVRTAFETAQRNMMEFEAQKRASKRGFFGQLGRVLGDIGPIVAAPFVVGGLS